MAKRNVPTPEQRNSLNFLANRLDEKQLRTLLSTENSDLEKPERTRILSKKRLANLLGGTGRLTEAEAERISKLRLNSRTIQNLNTRGRKAGAKDYQVNRAIRSFVDHGKERDAEKTPTSIRAIRALLFLGVDPDEGIFYLKG